MAQGKLFVPTDEDRKKVIEWGCKGITVDDMGALLREEGIDEETVRKHFKKEIRRGRAIAHEKMGGSLYVKALSDDFPALSIFYAKTQMGWKEDNKQETNNAFSFNMIIDKDGLKDVDGSAT
jgi:hypothetical protein